MLVFKKNIGWKPVCNIIKVTEHLRRFFLRLKVPFQVVKIGSQVSIFGPISGKAKQLGGTRLSYAPQS